MAPPNQPPQNKKTKSELLRLSTLREYVDAHSKPNGHGWKGFFHSNLFTALVLFLLSQSVVVTGLAISYYFKTSQLAEWKGQTQGLIDGMGKTISNVEYEARTLTASTSELKTRIEKVEGDTKHIEVLESEHRRLTKDVEELRNGKK